MGIVACSPLYPHFLQLVRLLIHREQMFGKPEPQIEWWRKGRKEREANGVSGEEKHDHRNRECSERPQDKDNQKEPAHFETLNFTFLVCASGRLPCTFLLLCHGFTYPTQKKIERGIGGTGMLSRFQVHLHTTIPYPLQEIRHVLTEFFRDNIPSFWTVCSKNCDYPDKHIKLNYPILSTRRGERKRL